MNDLAKDVQSYLEAQDLIDGTTGWASTRGALHDGSDRMVQVTGDPGALPEIATASGLGSAALSRPSVQVLVRGRADERDVARAKAAEIYDALHGLLGADLGDNTYMALRARASDFAQFYDDRSRPQFTMAYQALAAAAVA